MNILAFESSCDETSASVVSRCDDKFYIKSNIIASQVDTHRLYGGVVPEIASRAHIEAISSITYEALETAGVSISDIDLVAVTAAPGLIGALLVGVNFAKALAFANNIPLVAVDHIRGHIASAYLMEGRVPRPPFIALAASGGHTAIYRVDSYCDISRIGTTRDDAIGEAFDKVGRLIGLEYPAGRDFDRLASEGFSAHCDMSGDYLNQYRRCDAAKKPDFTLPSPALRDGSLDFSFSGLKTAAVNLIHRYSQRGCELPRTDFAAKYTFMVTDAVCSKISAALEANSGYDFVLVGGVAANSHLRHGLNDVCRKMGRKFFAPPPALCGDNGAMIAAAGYFEYERGNFADTSLNASALDTVI